MLSHSVLLKAKPTMGGIVCRDSREGYAILPGWSHLESRRSKRGLHRKRRKRNGFKTPGMRRRRDCPCLLDAWKAMDAAVRNVASFEMSCAQDKLQLVMLASEHLRGPLDQVYDSKLGRV
jgi:hypothetical protein